MTNQLMHDIRFTSLGQPRRIWAISSIHGELEKLYAIHDALLERLSAGDRIVYLGNITGYGAKSCETVDEILTFRRLALSQPGVHPTDIVYLRGMQENMWLKLYQLPYATNPEVELSKMLSSGLLATLESYGVDTSHGMRSCKEGVLALTRWTNKIRGQIRQNPAHDIFITQHKRAAYTDKNTAQSLLFVNAGLDTEKPLDDQGDSLWTKDDDFETITKPYAPFSKIIRGYDSAHTGVRVSGVTATLDGGAGFGGNIVCANIDAGGNIQELLQA